MCVSRCRALADAIDFSVLSLNRNGPPEKAMRDLER